MGMEIKGVLSKAYKWEYFWLCLLILATLVMHFIIINNPAELILDEQHYVNDARNISANHTTERLEHPPLGKLFIVAGIKLFGDKPVGWRFFPIIFGTASIALFYFLCRRLDMSRMASSIATFLLAFENLTFLQASVAMLDVFYVTFMIGAFLLYANRRYIASGISIGLSGLAKLNGALAGPVVMIHWIFTRRGRSWWFFLTVFFAVISFVELMIPFDFAISRHFATLADPLQRIKTMLSMSGSLTFATVDHPSESHPWDWLISYKPMAYWIMPHYTAAISFTIWAMIIPTFIYMLVRAIKGSNAGLFGVAWITSTYLVWIPATLITDRVTYIFYFYPTIGAICLGLGMALAQLLDIFRQRRSGKPKETFVRPTLIGVRG